MRKIYCSNSPGSALLELHQSGGYIESLNLAYLLLCVNVER